MNYNLISIDNVRKIKHILLNSQLTKDINITIPEMELSLQIDAVSLTSASDNFTDMEQTYFLHQNNSNVLNIKNRCYELFYNVGEWGYDTRIPNSHICLGSSPLKFGSKFFAQVELSQALEDEEYIFVVKNLSNLSGEGAISRINNGLKNNKDKKYHRRDTLVNELQKEKIYFKEKEWLCVTKICKRDLENEREQSSIFNSFINDFLNYAFLIEKIISNK